MDKKIKIASIILIVLQVFTVGLYAENLRQLQREQNLRDARGQIQIVTLRALVKSGNLTADDLAVIKQNWRDAEYGDFPAYISDSDSQKRKSDDDEKSEKKP